MASTIRERLALDHFYISLSREELRSLEQLTTIFRHCTSKRVVAGQEHWDGIYLMSRTGSYLELLHYPKAANIGIAFSDPQPQYTDVRRIKDELPEFRWKLNSQLNAQNLPWFDYLTTCEDEEDGNLGVYPWIMHYHFRHVESRDAPKGTRDIDRFKALHLAIDKQEMVKLKRYTEWFPGTVRSKNGLSLLLPDREGSTFEIHMQTEEGFQGVQFRKLEMVISDELVVEPIQIGKYALRPGIASRTMSFERLTPE